MKTTKIITMLALMISLLVGFTSDVNAQTVKQDSVVFYKDTVLVYHYAQTPMYWVGIPKIIFTETGIESNKNFSVSDTTILKLTKQFNQKVTVDSIKIDFKKIKIVLGGGSDDDVDVFTINNSNYYKLNSNTDTLIKTYTFDTLDTDNIVVAFHANLIGDTKLYILNPTIYYHYSDRTSVNENVNIISQIQFINNKFESTTKIDNIKVYDISGKLIQEGALNDTYQLDKNTLYFVLFDDKHFKKIMLSY